MKGKVVFYYNRINITNIKMLIRFRGYCFLNLLVFILLLIPKFTFNTLV